MFASPIHVHIHIRIQGHNQIDLDIGIDMKLLMTLTLIDIWQLFFARCFYVNLDTPYVRKYVHIHTVIGRNERENACSQTSDH